MADNVSTTLASKVPAGPVIPGGTKASEESSIDPNALGVYAPFPYSPEPFAELSQVAKGALEQLVQIATKTDVAARRMEVEQAWESLHFDRGYQHLLRGKQGGWIIPGAQTGFSAKDQIASHGIYDTNVYSPKGDIVVAALSREVPRVEFFPDNPKYAPDIIAAEEAERFKLIWARNNNLHALLVDTARIFWNEDRAVLWTRYVLNAQKYGYEEEPEVSTDEMLSTVEEPLTGQDGQEDARAQLDSPVNTDTSRRARGREVTTVHGKLECKVPIAVNCIDEMQFVQIYQDLDVAVAKGMFPWIAEKIKPGSDGTSEVELDRIARENTKQAVLGAYVTGDSMQRHTVVKWTWLRPSMFLDAAIGDEARAELLENFPDGCLVAKAGQELAFARNESMDDHLVIGHALSGPGQNRRSLGSTLISVQKRINDWADLLDDFFKRTVPKKWMNNDAFDIEAIKNQPNVPGSIGPFQPQPGLTTADQYIMVEPTPTPQPALPDFTKWFITSLSEEISGALPSLFGAPTNTDTVGGIAIQRDQALQRIGCPWNNIQDMFAVAAKQAVKCAAECREECLTETLPGIGIITVNPSNLSGNVQCYAESNPAFPESWQQKETRLLQMVDASTANTALQQWLFTPANLPILASGIRMKDFTIPGADSVTKQKAEFEILLRGAPVPNPQLVQATQQMEQAKQGMAADQAAGKPIPPQAGQMAQQLEQMLQKIPKLVSTVPVAQDESENHAMEAATCFDWLNSSEGQKFKNGDNKQKAAFQNVYLHWQEHSAMAKQIAAANAPPQKPPNESISAAVDKMPAPVAVQLLEKMGVQATPEDFDQHAKQMLADKVQAKALPQALKEPLQPEPKAPPQPIRQLKQ